MSGLKKKGPRDCSHSSEIVRQYYYVVAIILCIIKGHNSWIDVSPKAFIHFSIGSFVKKLGPVVTAILDFQST